MTYHTQKIADSVYAIAVWDASWNSLNNCYLLKRPDACIMIDACKADQKDELVAALSEVEISPEDVRIFLATHGHQDHVGGATLFTQAEKWIHGADANRLTEQQSAEFKVVMSQEGEIFGLRYILLGQHTEGSIALFDATTGCLFCGDHVCFFGEPLPSEGLVTLGSDLRLKIRDVVRQWFQSPADRSKYKFDKFVQGLRILAQFEAKYLATGHGPVLMNDIPEFLNDLARTL